MEYISTRGGIEPVNLTRAVMMGLADDGGLLLPATIPDVQAALPQWRQLAYADLAVEVIKRFSDADDLPPARLAQIVKTSYAVFEHDHITPVIPVGDLFIQEMFHGPTLAFKDLALQFLGNLFEYIIGRDGGRLNILVATSGDTGSAAIHGIRGRDHLSIFVLHPHNKVSELQERQMTTVLDDNVHNIAVEGTFDDGQRIIKALFGDLEFKQAHHLGAVNSINWARVLAQVVYYFYGAFRVQDQTGADKVDVCVPTGNFGNIFAGYVARRMGAPIDHLILATNQNDILSRYFTSGVYELGEVHPTSSPSMDIQVASNFERYLYYQLGQDGDEVARLMRQFQQTGRIAPAGEPDPTVLTGVCDEDTTLATIGRVYNDHGYQLDPHTAVGVHVAGHARRDRPVLCLATAHPAKFPEAVGRATGHTPTHPVLEDLKSRPTRCRVLPADCDDVRRFILETLA